MSSKVKVPIQPDWWMKSILGTILSLILAVGLGNLIIVLFKSVIAQDILVQIGMWSIAIFWLPLFFMCFYFVKGWHMLVIMSSTAIVVYSFMLWLRG